MKRSEIRNGMAAYFCRNSVRVGVDVIGQGAGPFFRVRFSDGGVREDVLPAELEPRKRPSARRYALSSVVAEYEAMGGVVKAGEREWMKKAEGE